MSDAPDRPAPSAPAGWYPSPEGDGQRFWDGSQWTDLPEPDPSAPSTPVAKPAAQEPKDPRRLRVWGWVGALVFTPVGLVIGIILLARRHTRDGALIVVVSVISAIVWNVFFYDALFGTDEPASTGGISESYLAEDLPFAVRANGNGTLTDVSCAQRSESEYRCLGEFKPSLSAIRDAYGDFPVSELRDVQDQETGPATLDVTVSHDGSYIWEFRP